MANLYTIRDLAAGEGLTEARRMFLKVLRREVRKKLLVYAEQNYIIDFFDNVLVEDAHRDYRQSLITQASSLVTQAQAATTVDHILALFDILIANIGE